MEDLPEGWPGLCWLEGRTLLQVPDNEGQAQWRKGPATRNNKSVFHNVAMAGNRTRSVLLLGLAIENGWLRDKGEIRVLDGLAASSVRARRWLNELPKKATDRLNITAVDRNEVALAWAKANHAKHPPSTGARDKLTLLNGDLRQLVFEGGWQWIDIDPYGSPIPFLDATMQNLARKAIIEISATDTAALCGSYPQVTRRRYAATAVNDELAHDTAMRILLANIALCAARHERYIEPLLSVFDGHHVRISILVRPGRKAASEVYQRLGWRISNPTHDQLVTAITAGLHDFGCADISQPRAFLPWDSPPKVLSPEKVSGPLWTGPLASSEVLEALQPELALSWCSPNPDADGERGNVDSSAIASAGWNVTDIDMARRAIERSVSRLAGWAGAVDTTGLICLDEMPRWTNIGGPPSVAKLVEKLTKSGYSAAIYPINAPTIQTNAPWDVLLTNAESCFDN